VRVCSRFLFSACLLIQLFDVFLEGEEDEPAFPMLPGSLMPRF
jgi:hypothetical protein